MSDGKTREREVTSAGHVSVHLDHLHAPRPVQFSFETGASRSFRASVVSLAIHAGVVAAVFFAFRVTGVIADPVKTEPINIVFLEKPGPGGGGGGGGNQSKITPKEIVIPKAVHQDFVPRELPETAAVPLPDFLATKNEEAMPDIGPNRGSGTGGGIGSGTGTGIGSGSGSGVGDGYGGGFGGGAYRPGSGIENPVLRREVKPQYTADAMRAKIQGTAVLDCVVRADGSVGECNVIRSLDSTFGLDQEAVKAAKQWRFAPGKRLGQPVPVLVTIEMLFSLR